MRRRVSSNAPARQAVPPQMTIVSSQAENVMVSRCDASKIR